ncbi:MAG: DUF3499 domain-containing protein [Demequinaceae bacterium]|nr:DUF3499 domain-containing protein [Demequinaceae bacterium]
MTTMRRCSKTPCGRPAVATLTYVYSDSCVVVGALSQHAEPHSYDLCAHHAEGFTAPRGWDVVHLHQEYASLPPSPDVLDALARAVREAGRSRVEEERPASETEPPRRGHLRVVSSEA